MNLAQSSVSIPRYEHSQEKGNLWKAYVNNGMSNVAYGNEDSEPYSTVIIKKSVNIIKKENPEDAQVEIDRLISKSHNSLVHAHLEDSKTTSDYHPNLPESRFKKVSKKEKAEDIISDEDLTRRRLRLR